MQNDEVIPESKWIFDEDVTECFDDMLRRCIPQYQVMRDLVTDTALYFVRNHSTIIDLGCSRGEALDPLVQIIKDDCEFVGIETSKPMIKVARKRFINCDAVEIIDMDLREHYPIASQVSVTLCVLTLQFIPIEHRLRVLQRAYNSTIEGGCFILVEKVLGNDCAINDLMMESHLSMKKENGYTQDQIDRKKLSLEGVLVPVAAKWNEDMLRSSGFQHVDCIWRWMNFAAWVAIK